MASRGLLGKQNTLKWRFKGLMTLKKGESGAKITIFIKKSKKYFGNRLKISNFAVRNRK